MIRKYAKGKKKCDKFNCLRSVKKDVKFCSKHSKKQEYKPKKTAKNYTYYEEKLWQEFSKFIKLRDTDIFGYGICITTKEPIYYIVTDNGIRSNCDAGHFISRRYKNLIFNEDNVHAQLSTDNRDQGNGGENFEDNLIQKIGQKRVEKLINQKKNIGRLSIDEIKMKIQYYRSENKKMLNGKSY